MSFWRKKLAPPPGESSGERLVRRDGRTGSPAELRCSFCNKAQQDVAKLIAGPTVFICDECVQVCNDIIARDPGVPPVEPEADAPAPDDDAPPGTFFCLLCSIPFTPADLVTIRGRGPICRDCFAAVREASAPSP